MPALESDPARTPQRPPTLRERTRRAVRLSVEESARDLFAQQGYESTTVEQIARAAGLSERSFFRYFASKEDLVMGVLLDIAGRVVDAFRSRPADETLWVALRRAFDVFDRSYDAAAPSMARPMHGLIQDSPALNAAFQVRRAQLQAELTAVARFRAADHELAATGDPRLDAVVGAGLACVEAAERAWLSSDTDVSFSALLDRAMAHARPDHLG